MAKIHVILVLLVFITSHSFVVSTKKEGMADMLQKLENDVEFLKEKLKSTVNENIEKRAGDDDDDDDDDDGVDILTVNGIANVEEEAKKDGEDLQEGDMFVTKLQEKQEEHDNDPNTPRDALTNPAALWDKGSDGRVRVPIVITSSISSNNRKASLIRTAIAKYKALTCIDIVPRQGTEHYIKVINDRGCYSLLGKAKRSGRSFQPLSIGNGCESLGTVEHEFLHALGFFHEQARPDRDKFIKVQLKNLYNPKLESQFRKQTAAGINSVGEPFDINSIMEYGSGAFAKSGKYTIVLQSTGLPFRANRRDFSKIDLAQINKVYKCGTKPAPKPAPKPNPNPNPGTGSSSKNCDGFVKMGLCDYKEICSACRTQCTAPGATSGWKVLANRRSDAQCASWQKAGYCNSKSARTKAFMSNYCLKACFQSVYPANNACQ